MLTTYLKLIIGISTILTIVSCSPAMTVEYIINNNSDSNITVYFEQSSFYTILKGEKNTVFIETAANEGGEPFRCDSVWIKNDTSTLTFYIEDYYENRNIFNVADYWDTKTVYRKRFKAHFQYTYTITEDDFVSNDDVD